MIPKRVFPTTTEIRRDRTYWNPRCLTYLRQRMYFEDPVRTGECFFCKKHGWRTRAPRTYLHHVKYDEKNPLFWTVEVCGSCHYRIDPANKRILDWKADQKSGAFMQKYRQHFSNFRQFR
jgi:hypothetical protein